MIKSGELSIIYLSDCEIDGKKTDAIAMLKTENKQPAFQYLQTEYGYEIQKSEVISFAKVEKGCLIFNFNGKRWLCRFLCIKKSRVFSQSIGKTILHIMTDVTSYSTSKQQIFSTSLVKLLVA